jgi:hypothetical protein
MEWTKGREKSLSHEIMSSKESEVIWVVIGTGKTNTTRKFGPLYYDLSFLPIVFEYFEDLA